MIPNTPPEAPAVAPPMGMSLAPEDEGMDDGSIEAIGAGRRKQVAGEALRGDPSTLPTDVQDALTQAATAFAAATGTSDVLQGSIDDVVALIASAHQFLSLQQAPEAMALADALNPAALVDPQGAQTVIAALQQATTNPEVLELFKTGGGPPDAPMEAAEPLPDEAPPTPMTLGA